MKRRIVPIVIIAVILIGAAGWYLYQRQALRNNAGEALPLQDRVTAEPAPEKQVDSFVVVSVTGQVERRANDAEGWVAVQAGDRLQRHESIKTNEHSRVRLTINETSEIELNHLSEITVNEIAEAVHRLNLVQGKIQVNYDEDASRVLNISIEESEASVRTTAGKFDHQSSDKIVSVATVSGTVKLTAKEKTVNVGPGKISRVLPGSAPSQAVPIPLSVMLRVAKKQKRVQIARTTTIRGQTDVGARVRINNAPVVVGADGKFKVKVPLDLGKNKIIVMAEDVVGNTRVQTLPEIKVVRPPPGKVTETKVRWGKI